MQVDTNVSEADVGEVRLGQEAFFTVQAFPGKTFRGNVTQIRHGPITVQNVVTYDVVIAVPNPDRSLFPGMTADTHIVTAEHDAVLRVPLPAVRFNPGGLAALGKTPSSRTPEAGRETVGADTARHRPQDRSENAGEAVAEREPRRPDGRGDDGRRRGDDGRRRGDDGRRRGDDGNRGGGARDGGDRPGRGESRRAHSQVWVLNDDGTLKAVAVTTGLDDGALIEVSGSDLHTGDKVVVNAITPESGGPRTPRTAPGQAQVFRQAGVRP